MAIWKINCMEDQWPGLWQRWFRSQCVAVGWPPKSGKDSFRLEGGWTNASWSRARSGIKKVEVGEWVVVQLKGHRVGRMGQVVEKLIRDDEWEPLVPKSREWKQGEMGRRINVRWDLALGPTSPDWVVRLPVEAQIPRGRLRQTICTLSEEQFGVIRTAMADEANWVSLLAHFAYERSLSDYIATFPHHLEDGLEPYPNSAVRERVFDDRSRLDVLLIDRRGTPVVVECKQATPTVEHLRQLRGYMKHLRRETGLPPRGILVHGGAAKLRDDVRKFLAKHADMEIVRYRLDVDFAPCR